jgi:integrase
METETLAVTQSKVTRRTGQKARGVFEKVLGSGVWWIRYVDAQGRYRREKAGTLSTAKTLYHKRKTEALQGIVLPENLRRKHVPFSEIAEDALNYSRQNKRSFRSDEAIKNHLVEWFGAHGADSLMGTELQERLEAEAGARKWAASTFNHYRSFLMLAYREAKRQEKVRTNPARDIRHRKENNDRVRFLSRGRKGEGNEYERLLKVIRETHPEHLPEFLFAVNTGLRLSSQYSATYEMIDWTQNVLRLPRTKNDKALHIPLNTNALVAIRSLPSWQEPKGAIFRSQRHPEKPVLSNDHWFKPALRAAGISDFKWHDLRHTFASWLIQDGVALERVSKLLGHSSLMMTMRYAHLAPNQLHDDVAILTRNSTSVAPEAVSEKLKPVMSLIN